MGRRRLLSPRSAQLASLEATDLIVLRNTLRRDCDLKQSESYLQRFSYIYSTRKTVAMCVGARVDVAKEMQGLSKALGRLPSSDPLHQGNAQ